MFISSGQTHQGVTRTNNQDAIFMDDNAGIWIVADGMGGHNAGEVASQVVCEYLPKNLSYRCQNCQHAIYAVHEQIKALSIQNPEYAGMGATMIAAVQKGNDVDLYWSGDCRAYLISSSECRLLSKDHSAVQKLIDLNIIDNDAAKIHPQRHLVTSCLGGSISKPDIDNISISLPHNETLMLCSDGLYKELSESEITNILAKAKHISQASEMLIAKANQHGGRDNISLILISLPA